jgi:hypothetical protein
MKLLLIFVVSLVNFELGYSATTLNLSLKIDGRESLKKPSSDLECGWCKALAYTAALYKHEGVKDVAIQLRKMCQKGPYTCRICSNMLEKYETYFINMANWDTLKQDQQRICVDYLKICQSI